MAKKKDIPITAEKEEAAPAPPSPPTTLYCSFCGKSQYEVVKLVAGVTVCICDECVDLCADIVDEEGAGIANLPDGRKRFAVHLRFAPALTQFEVETFPLFVKKVGEAFPDCEVSLRQLAVHANSARLDVVSAEVQDVKSLQREVASLALKLRVAQQKLLAEADTRAALERQLRNYEAVIASRAVEELKSRGDWPAHNRRAMLFCFVDVVGFSRLAPDARSRTVELLRNVVGMLLRTQRADLVNMWGDGIFATFDDPQLGLECACLFVRHLELYGLNVRVGVSWGVATVGPNSAIGRSDVDGACVDLAARLEAIADPGEVICSEEVPHLDEIDKERFAFAPISRLVKKAFGELQQGALLSAHSVALRKNAGSLLEETEGTPTIFPEKSDPQ